MQKRQRVDPPKKKSEKKPAAETFVCEFEGCGKALKTAAQLRQHRTHCVLDPSTPGHFYCGMVSCTVQTKDEEVRASTVRASDFKRHLRDQHAQTAGKFTSYQVTHCRRVKPPKPTEGFSTLGAFVAWLLSFPRDAPEEALE